MPEFSCNQCSASFSVSDQALAKYPGWTPKVCMKCKKASPTANAAASPTGGKKKLSSNRGKSGTREEDLPLAEVLLRYTDGPQDGVFTDGAAHPNPGQGGWGVVWVEEGKIIKQAHGHEPDTTNNRMELCALIEAFKMLPLDANTTVHTDSDLCVKTITLWAKSWEKAGWKRKTGPIKNLELVQELYALSLERKSVKLQWVPAHSGYRWNEYADSLSTAYRRSQL